MTCVQAEAVFFGVMLGSFCPTIAIHRDEISAVLHLAIISHSYPPSVGKIVAWWPSFGVPHPRDTTLQSVVYHFMKWDSIIWYTSSILAISLLEGSRRETLLMLAAAPLVSLAVSPGAVIALYWLRREEQLQRDQLTLANATAFRKKL
ncbi:hypothetical protein AURDEDRAFT_163636 [Auricularia subglabra TFB-10046 SS5]|nr:hypothetical protein AURDEDRAFT_163636 [Auricularia subglabra TFB-10046 SS5]